MVSMSAVTAVATVAVLSAETAALPSAVRVMSSIIAPVVSPIVTAPVAGVAGSWRDHRWRRRLQVEVLPPLDEIVVKALDPRVDQKLDFLNSFNYSAQTGPHDGKSIVGEVDLIELQKKLVIRCSALPN